MAEVGLGDIFNFVFAAGWGFGDSESHWGWEFGTMGKCGLCLCGSFCLNFKVRCVNIYYYFFFGGKR